MDNAELELIAVKKLLDEAFFMEKRNPCPNQLRNACRVLLAIANKITNYSIVLLDRADQLQQEQRLQETKSDNPPPVGPEKK